MQTIVVILVGTLKFSCVLELSSPWTIPLFLSSTIWESHHVNPLDAFGLVNLRPHDTKYNSQPVNWL